MTIADKVNSEVASPIIMVRICHRPFPCMEYKFSSMSYHLEFALKFRLMSLEYHCEDSAVQWPVNSHSKYFLLKSLEIIASTPVALPHLPWLP